MSQEARNALVDSKNIIAVDQIDDRFWSKVARDPIGCWEWTASKNKFGYGQIQKRPLTGRASMMLAHRYSAMRNIPGIFNILANKTWVDQDVA